MPFGNTRTCPMIRNRVRLFAVCLLAGSAWAQDGAAAWEDNPKLKMGTVVDHETGHRISRGSYTVWENRQAQAGRTIDLSIVILHATGNDPKPDPVFEIGPPGYGATTSRPAI